MSQWPFGDLRLKGMSPGLRTPMYPYVALRCPTYRVETTQDNSPKSKSINAWQDLGILSRFPAGFVVSDCLRLSEHSHVASHAALYIKSVRTRSVIRIESSVLPPMPSPCQFSRRIGRHAGVAESAMSIRD